MATSAYSFPHPVLGNGDDMEGSFEWTSAVKLTREKVVITAEMRLKNADLEALLKNGKASYLMQVQCPLTFYRETFLQVQPDFKIELPASVLRERVALEPRVIASKAVERYAPKTAHGDYSRTTFEIMEGTVLAVAPEGAFIAEKEFAAAKRRLRSIMEFVRHRREGAEPEYRLEQERIQIFLNAKDWETYQRAKTSPGARHLIHSSIIFPVLMEALSSMEDEQYFGLRWRERLAVLLRDKGAEELDVFQQAMALLRNPISRGLEGIAGLMDEAEDEDS